VGEKVNSRPYPWALNKPYEAVPFSRFTQNLRADFRSLTMEFGRSRRTLMMS
jgi:hypothetical protein